MNSIIDFAHELLKTNISKKDIVLDLTVGRGLDTYFLVQYARFVYGFDIQDKALDSAKKKLIGFTNYKLIKDSHLNFPIYVKESFKAAIMNLGYLPGGEKSITTTAEITLKTIKNVLEKISVTGICVVVVYPGHKEGLKESNMLGEYLKMLDQRQYAV